MSLSNLKQSAARSAARQAKRKAPSPPPLEPGLPEGEIKQSKTGKKYRLYKVSLEDLPSFLARKEFESKLYFRYLPEVEFDKEGKEIPYSGDVLGVRRNGETEEREL